MTVMTGTGITYSSGSKQTTAMFDQSYGINTIVYGCYKPGGAANYFYGTGTTAAASDLAADIGLWRLAQSNVAIQPVEPQGAQITTGATNPFSKTVTQNQQTFRASAWVFGQGVYYNTPSAGTWTSLGAFGYTTTGSTNGVWNCTLWRRTA